MDKKKTIALDTITLIKVSLDDIEVGATNLALYTDRARNYIHDGTNNWFRIEDDEELETAAETDEEEGYAPVVYPYGPRMSDLGLQLLPNGGNFTLSFDYSVTGCTTAFELIIGLESADGVYSQFGSTETIAVRAAQSGHFATTSTPSSAQMQWGRGFQFMGVGTTTNPDIKMTIRNFKFEKGNVETTWSQAPEELASGEYVDDIEVSLSDDIAGLEEDINNAYIDIDSINSTIASLVTDENGTSLMTQTSDGWTFNIGAIQNSVDKALDDIDTIHGNLNDANKVINNTKDLVDDISQKTSYINIGQDESGAPCILLGETTSPFKLRITNTSIDFMEGSDKIAYVTNRQLYIQSSVVTDEMRVGSMDKTGKFEGFVWKKRSNGNMGLRWEGDFV